LKKNHSFAEFFDKISGLLAPRLSTWFDEVNIVSIKA